MKNERAYATKNLLHVSSVFHTFGQNLFPLYEETQKSRKKVLMSRLTWCTWRSYRRDAACWKWICGRTGGSSSSSRWTPAPPPSGHPGSSPSSGLCWSGRLTEDEIRNWILEFWYEHYYSSSVVQLKSSHYCWHLTAQGKTGMYVTKHKYNLKTRKQFSTSFLGLKSLLSNGIPS